MEVITWESAGKNFLVPTYLNGQYTRGPEKRNEITNRKFNTFLYIKSGYYIIESKSGKRLALTPGNLLYIPKGASYTTSTSKESFELFFLDFNLKNLDTDNEVAFSDDIELITDQMPENLKEVTREFSSYRPNRKRGTMIHSLYLFSKILYNVIDIVAAYKIKKGSSYKVSYAIAYTHGHYTEPLTVEDMAKRCNMSVSRFHECFKAQTGQTFINYRNHLRLERAKILLIQNQGKTIGKIATMVGFSDPLYFSKCFRKYFGQSPKEYVGQKRY